MRDTSLQTAEFLWSNQFLGCTQYR
jgi:hypothetical protein